MDSTSRKIVVALRMAGIAGQDKLNGIFDHLSNGHRWMISLYRSPEEFTADTVRHHLKEGVDGFIVGLPRAKDALAVLARSRVPTVAMNIELGPLKRRRRNLFVIKGDDMAVGREAANEFLRHGRFRSFGFIPYEGNPEWCAERCSGFTTRLREKGYGVAIYRRNRPLGEWLAALDKPTAIFASCDDEAYTALDVCRANGWSVPADIAVLGVNNDILLCENAEPRLSSIQPDNEGEGRLAARLLEKMMNDFRCNLELNANVRTHLVPIKEVVLRDSTPAVSVAGALVQKAVDFINRRALLGIGVDNVATYVGVSRSLLDLRFRENLNSSVYEMILKRRLDEVKRLLKGSNKSMLRIANECGWSNMRSMMNVFRRTFGISAGKWRTNARK